MPERVLFSRSADGHLIPDQGDASLAFHDLCQRVLLRRIANASPQADESPRRRYPDGGVAKPLVDPDRLDNPIIDFRIVFVRAAALAGAGETARCSTLGARVRLRDRK